MDTGNIGEDLFSQWCNQADLIPNKATTDKDGWDFLVALPKVFNKDLKSLDKDDSHDQILVQVKATQKEKGNRSIKLSNLKKLVDTALPSFYLLILLSDEGEPEKAYLFHVWEVIIAKVQKRLRDLPKDEWNRTNEIKLTLPWKASQELNKLHGKELYRLLSKNLKESKSEYSNKKNHIRESVGYNEEKLKINIQSVIPDSYKDKEDEFMIDLFLGEIDQVKVLESEFIDKRFGKEIIQDRREGGYFKLENIEPEGAAIFELNTCDFRSSIKLHTNMYVPKGAGNFVSDDSKLKILFKSKFIKIYFYTKSGKMEFNFAHPNFNDEAKIAELLEISNLFLFLNEIEIDEKLHFQITVKDKPFYKGEVMFPKYSAPLPIKHYKTIRSSYRLLSYSSLDTDIIIIPSELINQSRTLIFFHELLSPKPTFLKLEFMVDSELGGFSEIVGFAYFSVQIGEYLITIEVKVKGQPILTDTQNGRVAYKLHSNDVRIEQHRVIKGNKEDYEYIKDEMQEISSHKHSSDDTLQVFFEPEKLA